MKLTRFVALTVFGILLLRFAVGVGAEPIYVPNASFELPVTDFVTTNMVSWETVPPTPEETQGAIGVFYNDPEYIAYGDYIYNCDGNQAAYIFADSGLALFQDYNSMDSSQLTPSHAFNAKFEVGRSYKLVTGIIGGDQGAAPGVILQMSVYYRDASSNMITVASTNIVNDPTVFTSLTNFVDYELDVPVVSASNAWAGQNIGIQFLSIVPANVSPGGDWDLDNVRLSSSIYVPNYSFELPVTDFVATNMISWETFPPTPAETQGAIGVFYNNPEYTNEGSYITNCDGNQAAYIFADPGLAIFQDYNSMDSSQVTPSHAFNATYDLGKVYKLIVAVIGGDQGMTPGASLELELYYRDTSNNMVTVAATNLIYDPTVFTSITNFIDCEVDTAPVKASDPWTGQNIGIQILSTVSPDLEGGDWDLDNVRLSEVLPPSWIGPVLTNGVFTATLQSDPGAVFQILATTNLTIPVANWTSLTTLTNTSGTISFQDTSTNSPGRFYTAEEVSSP
jgi:hypothetical protein